MDHELKQLEQSLADQRTRLETRQRLRELNSYSNFEYPSESTLSALDSSIKKNSAFVKRIKLFTDSQKDQVLNEIDRLNLTKFISEVATSIVEAKFKLSDITAVIEICTKLNRKYKDFSKHLLDQYGKSFPVIKKKPSDQFTCHQFSSSSTNVTINNCPVGSSSNNAPSRIASRSSTSSTTLVASTSSSSLATNNDPSQINLSKVRVDLRIFSELLLVGIFELKDGFTILMNLLYYLMVYDKNSHQNASAILTFCKGCGDELLGLARLKLQPLCEKYGKEFEECNLISAKRQEFLRLHVLEYYSSLAKHLGNLHKEYTDIIFKNKKNRKSNGEITKESRELLEIKQSEIVKFHNLLNQFAEVLNQEPAALPNLDALDETKDASVLDLYPTGDKGSLKLPTASSPWDDEGTRSFYEDLLDLKTLFPNLTVKASTLRKKLALQQRQICAGPETSGDLGDKDSKSNSPDMRTTTPAKSSEDGNDELDKTLDSSSSDESSDEAYSSSNAVASSSSNMALSQLVINRVQPDQYFVKLSNCSNRDMIDEATIDFMRFFNTKFGRRKLIKTLFNVQRTRLDLLPFFARLSATLYPYVPSIGTELSSLLRQEFRNLFRKKDQINIESKVKNVRFIGELIKFNLFSEDDALTCLSMLLSDFTHHHIEMTCNLLETCGRLLYTSPVSHHKCRLFLEQMMRKKLLLSVDSKYVTMIENAYYYTNPPEIVRHVVEEPDVNLYIRFLLCDCLSRSTIDRVLSSLKKLDWSNKELAKFIITCMIESYNLKFFNIRYLAALLAALNKVHPWISSAVIDGVVEDILLMMEINELHFNQRRIPMIRYFGELYNYKLSDSSLVFKILYILITYGVYYPEPNQTLSQIPLSRLDPPDNLFRIKLVCDLLDTSGHFLINGPEKKKLDCFLLFFQRYYWFKRHIYNIHPYCMAKSGNQFPASIEYSYNDAILNLRPNISLAKSYPQAIEDLRKFVAQLNEQQCPATS